MFCIIDLIDYYLKPKYVVMKGSQVENRAIMFMGKVVAFRYDEYSNKVVTLRGRSSSHYYDSIYKRIWTYRQIIKWRRLLGSEDKVLKKVNGKWIRI